MTGTGNTWPQGDDGMAGDVPPNEAPITPQATGNRAGTRVLTMTVATAVVDVSHETRKSRKTLEKRRDIRFFLATLLRSKEAA
jgi:hypothetical protein